MAFVFTANNLGVQVGQQFIPLRDRLSQQKRPVYVYDLQQILKRAEDYRRAFQRSVEVHYAVKANSHPTLVKALSERGVGADVVSSGELNLALNVGMATHKVVFSGVGKSADELLIAIEKKIGQINVESLPELVRVARVAQQLAIRAKVALRLNPDIHVDTHPHITTGTKKNKFGLDEEQLPEALEILRTYSGALDFVGLAAHIGSQMLETTPIVQATQKLYDIYQNLCREGWKLQTLDIGGGLGIDYSQDDVGQDHKNLLDMASGVSKVLKTFSGRLFVEPGRYLVGRAGVLLAQVEYVKKTPHKTFVILNSGMNHLMRPALYQAVHRVVPVILHPERPQIKCDVVGPICESSDILRSDCWLQDMQPEEWVAVLDVGAYGYTMANNYNLCPFPDEWVLG